MHFFNTVKGQKNCFKGRTRLYKTISTYMHKSTKVNKKKGENDRYVERGKKAMWRIINTEAGNFPSYDKKKKIQLKTETGTVTNLQK